MNQWFSPFMSRRRFTQLLGLSLLAPEVWAGTQPDSGQGSSDAGGNPSTADDNALSPPPLDKMSVMLDWYVNPSHGPLIVAARKGLFKEYGLDVELSTPADPSAPPKLVAAGRSDLAVSYQPQLHLQVDQGLPLRRVGTLIGTPLNIVMTRADSGIEQLSDLKGKRIGYSVGGVEEVLLEAMLNHADLTREDVELVNVNFSLTPALISGRVDAVTGAFRNFEPAQMAQEGVKGHPFYIEEEGVPIYDELILVANGNSLPEQRDRISRFLKAVEFATMWIINHPEESWEVFRSWDASLDNEVNRQAWRASLPRFALRPAAVDVRRYQEFGQFLQERGAIEQTASLDQLTVDVNRTPAEQE
ncbi:putative hydroxymethylpyrimidine transport system substrate-binding protein [Kushneria sinocarnis]|uniref:Putative hydroxymethylpyrimidine transport system substrate-binding protein n=1 Tax=Kushneria sinocarnis TaxID=595502 RepID=A0A420WYH9_9GAMM|nr:ABC transporter substrate-binding protein [Kushneria sinocarnis]RKR06236.1 putative hydroxymethylpyrimidine transport system substrate-binding protein [Kushneria sinocarnis]